MIVSIATLEEIWKYVYSWAKRGGGAAERVTWPTPPYSHPPPANATVSHPTVSHRIPPYDPYPDSDGRTSTAYPWSS